MDLCDLSVEIPGHEAFALQFHTVHLGFDTASAVVFAPSPPKHSAQVSRFVSGNGTGACRFPRFGILARLNDRVSAPRGN